MAKIKMVSEAEAQRAFVASFAGPKCPRCGHYTFPGRMCPTEGCDMKDPANDPPAGPRLSRAQREVMAKLATAQPPVLQRWPGGFWTTPGIATEANRPGVPVWWTGIATVRALETLGLLVRAERHLEEWRDDRRLAT